MGVMIGLSGMTGSGKSVVADELVKRGYQFLRFGQITLDIVKERGLEPIEVNERPIREQIRKEHGMGAYAILNLPKIEAMLQQGNVVVDNLMSWSEYKVLKEKYDGAFFAIAVYASPELRYKRLKKRALAATDVQLRHRPATLKAAKSRDYAEIENIEKGGPLAMADYNLVNTGNVKNVIRQLDRIMKQITKKVEKFEAKAAKENSKANAAPDTQTD